MYGLHAIKFIKKVIKDESFSTELGNWEGLPNFAFATFEEHFRLQTDKHVCLKPLEEDGGRFVTIKILTQCNVQKCSEHF